MWIDLINVAIAAVTLGVTVVIYSLGRRIGLRARMERRSDIAGDLAEFTRRIYIEGQNSTLLLMNANRYARGDYTAYRNEGRMPLSRHGALFVGGEFVGLRDDGFEIITGATDSKHPGSLVVAFVPLDAVQWVNLDGDEHFNRAIIYTTFAGPFPMPQAYSYPVEANSFKVRDGGRDYYRRIDGSKLARSTGLRAWWSAPAHWLQAIRFSRSEWRAQRAFARSAQN